MLELDAIFHFSFISPGRIFFPLILLKPLLFIVLTGEKGCDLNQDW